jgi:hypothetical protein
MDLMFVPWMGRAKLVPVLNVIAFETRKLYSRALSSKAATVVRDALHDTIGEAKGDIRSITSDNGSEFIGAATRSMLERESIDLHLVPAGDKETVGIVERVNRTLKGLIAHYAAVVAPNWKPVLQDLVDNYNDTPNADIGAAPDKVDDFTQWKDFVHKWLAGSKYRALLNSFKPGDSVRVALRRKAFNKEGQNWSKQLYTVEGTEGYRVKLSDGSTHVAREVQKVSGVEPTATKAAAPRAAKLRVGRALREIADYTTAPSADQPSALRSAGHKELEAIRFRKKVPRSLAALQDFNGMPAH